MPEGIEILLIKPIPPGIKSLAALIEYGSYEICFALLSQGDETTDLAHLREQTSSFICQNEILTKKVQKKTEKEVEIDLKPFIYNNSLEIDYVALNENISPVLSLVNDNYYMLNCILKTGSSFNINPELLLKEFFLYLDISPLEGSILIRRRDLYYLKNHTPDSLANI